MADGVTIEARQIVLIVRNPAAVHPDVAKIPGPLEQLHDAIVGLDDIHCRADAGERDQPRETERFAASFRIVAKSRQNRTAIADMKISSLRCLFGTELDSASRPVGLESRLSFRCHRRRLAEKAITGPRSRIAALGAGAEIVLIGRPAPQPVEIVLVVVAGVAVR